MADDKKKEPRKYAPPPMTKAQKDKAVARDPDIRGVNAGRRGRHNDQRLADGNDPARVEHVMNNGQRRGRR